MTIKFGTIGEMELARMFNVRLPSGADLLQEKPIRQRDVERQRRVDGVRSERYLNGGDYLGEGISGEPAGSERIPDLASYYALAEQFGLSAFDLPECPARPICDVCGGVVNDDELTHVDNQPCHQSCGEWFVDEILAELCPDKWADPVRELMSYVNDSDDRESDERADRQAERDEVARLLGNGFQPLWSV